MIPSVWVEPSGKVLIAPAAKERPRFIFKERTQIHFQAATLSKTMTLCGFSAITK